VAGIPAFKGIKAEDNAIFFQAGQGAAIRHAFDFRKKLGQCFKIWLAGYVHGRSPVPAVFSGKQFFLERRIDNMSVKTVAQQCLANSHCFLDGLVHVGNLCSEIKMKGYYQFTSGQKSRRLTKKEQTMRKGAARGRPPFA
jgi:hypothetical protein